MSGQNEGQKDGLAIPVPAELRDESRDEECRDPAERSKSLSFFGFEPIRSRGASVSNALIDQLDDESA